MVQETICNGLYAGVLLHAHKSLGDLTCQPDVLR